MSKQLHVAIITLC